MILNQLIGTEQFHKLLGHVLKLFLQNLKKHIQKMPIAKKLKHWQKVPTLYTENNLPPVCVNTCVGEEINSKQPKIHASVKWDVGKGID